MSETGESDDGYQNLNCRRGRKRKIIMRIEFNDGDEASTDSDVSDANLIRPTSRFPKRNPLKRAIISSDDCSSCEDEVSQRENGSGGKNDEKDGEEKNSETKKPDEDGFATDSSSDETLEKCPICLLSFRNQEIATPESCEHIFCFICLEEWAKNVTTCPIDRREFKTIIVKDSFLGKNVVREVKAEVENADVEEVNEEMTYCQICHQPNREDVMLLCDGCNQGYHMDCLTPPLQEIPEGSWYCDHCFESEGDDVADDLNQVYEDLREMGIPESRLRITEVRQQRVPRTRQIERVRARVIARNTDEQRTSETYSVQPSTSTSTRERTKKRKTRKRRTTRRRRTYVVEYDVNNYDEKFACKETKRYIKKRKSRKRKKRGKKPSCGRGVGGISRDERPLMGSQSFSLFGNPNDLEYFSDSDGGVEQHAAGPGSTSIQTAVRLHNPSLRRRKNILTQIDAPTRVDVLSNIMELQDRWHSMTQRNQLSNVRIGADGTLLFQENASNKETNENKKNDPPINEAPLYPRGNNPNFSGGDRYDNHSNNYRNNSGFRNSGNPYRHSTGSSGFNANPFRRDDNNSGHFNRSLHQVFSNNIHISPSFTERLRNQQNQRPERRNSNQFGNNNQSSNGGQTNEEVPVEASTTPPRGEDNGPSESIADIPIPEGVGGNGNTISSEENEPLNYSSSELNSSAAPSVVPPLEPPPWNNNLFRLAGDYDDDDDDADCPNFSIYSAESLQVARSSKEENDDSNSKDPEKGQEDDFEDKEEDLVQLDDDEIPDAIESGKKDTNDSSDIYEPDNPTDVLEEEVDNNDNECIEKTPENNNVELENETEIEPQTIPEEKIKINKPFQKSKTNKKGVLELYDESDWDEWNIDKNKLMEQTCENAPSSEIVEKEKEISEPEEPEEAEETVKVPENIQTESISEEEDRSYTPCLDEKMEHDESTQNKDESHTPPKLDESDKVDSDRGDRSTTVIDGMETEMISDEDEEILSQEQQTASASKKKDKDKDETTAKKPRKETFKKISKSTKERNYRGDKERVKGKRGRSRSRSNDKENRGDPKRHGRKRVRRKEIERYDVRNIIGQPRTYKDRYGRDTSRPARSRTRSRSRSHRKRSRSRSKFRSRSGSSRRNRRSFSISPSPVSYLKSSSYRRSLSSHRSRSRRSRSRRRTPVRRRSRTPLRIRSTSPRANGRRKQKFRRRLSHSASSRSRSRSRSRVPSPRRGRSSSLSRIKNKRKKSKDRKKKKNKKRTPSMSLSPAKRMSRPNERREIARKKKRPRTKSPIDHTWSPTSPRPVIPENNDSSWTPPLASNTGNLTVILKNKETAAEAKKKAEKKKKKERRRDAARKERRKQRSEVRESPIAPSKEVFASGDNILVSVSFNKEGNLPLAPPQQTTVVTLPPTRGEIMSKRRSAEQATRKQKRAKDKNQRKHKKTDAKPVAIIDLDRSPFQEIVQSPKDVIILTDSDQEVDEHGEFNSRGINLEIASLEQTNGDHQHDDIEKCVSVERTETIQEESFESTTLQQLGPKTPPEPPVVKFSLAAKSKQIKARNPLHEEQDEVIDEPVEENAEEIEKSSANKIGPNTPPESGPCSPDAYDPFDPTKSPSISPSPPPPAEMSTPVHNESSPAEEGRENRPQIMTTQEKSMNPVDLVMALMNSKSNKSHEMCNINTDQQYAMPANVEVNEIHEKGEDGNMPKAITVISNVLITSGKSQQRSSNLPTIASPVSKSSQSMGIATQSIVSKLPLPRTSSTNRHSSGNDENINEIESPYSPGSDDYDDLFEPPPENCTTLQQLSQRARMQEKRNRGNKTEIFENLFGNTSPLKIPSYTPTTMRKRGGKYKKTSVKVAKVGGKIDEDQIKIFDDLPSSAVELQVKDKFLRKLNRQERVVEEVKVVLKPHYNKKHITKDDYKEILRRAVPKICHSRSQEINPKKIQNLIEAYVKKFRQRNKLSLLNTGQVSSAVKCAAYLKKL